MRIASLLAFVIFFPVFACLPVGTAHAAGLININIADATLLDTLPGIGPSKAAAVISYRGEHGPFARIEDIKEVTGIGDSIYTDIAQLITVGDVKATVAPIVATTTTLTSAVASAPTREPASLALSVSVIGERKALLGVPLHLSARVTKGGGTTDMATQVSWSFGDGSSALGNVVEKTYRYAGMYLIVVTATDGSMVVRDDLVVVVKPATIQIAAVPGEGIVLANDSNERLDLSGWRLSAEMRSFRIPEGMAVLPNASVLLPYSITDLPMSYDAMLAYPDGAVAARSVPPKRSVAGSAPVAPSGEQPSSVAARYESVQAVEPALSTSVSGAAHEKTAVSAPVATTELAAAGAALPASPPAFVSRTAGIFKSPWTLSFLGVVALAGSAFIFL